MKWLISIILLFSVFLVDAEEYWNTYAHLTDKDNFDAPAMMYNRITPSQAKSTGAYTVVQRDKTGAVIEALSMLNGNPNYYYSYYYKDGEIVARNMFAFFGEQETLLSEVLYAYDDKGKLLSTAYYSIPFGSNKRELKYTKVYHGQNYVIYDYTPPPDDGVRSALESIEREVKRLQKLEKRGLIKKILGWE